MRDRATGSATGGHRLHEWFLSGADADHKAISGRLAGVNGTVVDDVRTAMSEAKRAAGDKNVLVHGAGTAQLALAAGVLDELEIHLIPVLLGHGRRLFENLDLSIPHIELERTRIPQGDAGVTHMHYRVMR
jgi:dihydrofolate reductase